MNHVPNAFQFAINYLENNPIKLSLSPPYLVAAIFRVALVATDSLFNLRPDFFNWIGPFPSTNAKKIKALSENWKSGFDFDTEEGKEKFKSILNEVKENLVKKEIQNLPVINNATNKGRILALQAKKELDRIETLVKKDKKNKKKTPDEIKNLVKVAVLNHVTQEELRRIEKHQKWIGEKDQKTDVQIQQAIDQEIKGKVHNSEDIASQIKDHPNNKNKTPKEIQQLTREMIFKTYFSNIAAYAENPINLTLLKRQFERDWNDLKTRIDQNPATQYKSDDEKTKLLEKEVLLKEIQEEILAESHPKFKKPKDAEEWIGSRMIAQQIEAEMKEEINAANQQIRELATSQKINLKKVPILVIRSDQKYWGTYNGGNTTFTTSRVGLSCFQLSPTYAKLRQNWSVDQANFAKERKFVILRNLYGIKNQYNFIRLGVKSLSLLLLPFNFLTIPWVIFIPIFLVASVAKEVFEFAFYRHVEKTLDHEAASYDTETRQAAIDLMKRRKKDFEDRQTDLKNLLQSKPETKKEIKRKKEALDPHFMNKINKTKDGAKRFNMRRSIAKRLQDFEAIQIPVQN